jgi:hypothetical protein
VLDVHVSVTEKSLPKAYPVPWGELTLGQKRFAKVFFIIGVGTGMIVAGAIIAIADIIRLLTHG